jgi:hypothetical protein
MQNKFGGRKYVGNSDSKGDTRNILYRPFLGNVSPSNHITKHNISKHNNLKIPYRETKNSSILPKRKNFSTKLGCLTSHIWECTLGIVSLTSHIWDCNLGTISLTSHIWDCNLGIMSLTSHIWDCNLGIISLTSHIWDCNLGIISSTSHIWDCNMDIINLAFWNLTY